MESGQDRVLDRLSVHTGLLDQIMSALQPQEEGSAGLDELLQALVDLTTAVTEQAHEIAALRLVVLSRSHGGDAAA